MRDHVIIYDFRCAQRVNYENLLKLAPNSNRTHSDPTQKMKRPMERKNNEWRGWKNAAAKWDRSFQAMGMGMGMGKAMANEAKQKS